MHSARKRPAHEFVRSVEDVFDQIKNLAKGLFPKLLLLLLSGFLASLAKFCNRGAVLAAHISLTRLGVSAPSFHAKARHMIHRPVNAHLGRLVPEPCAARNSSRWQFCDHGALAPPPHYGFALTAYRETAAAFETLSDPNSPKKEILTKWSHNSRVRSRNPGPSAPRTKARGRSRY
jgi:hypothetical protein